MAVWITSIMYIHCVLFTFVLFVFNCQKEAPSYFPKWLCCQDILTYSEIPQKTYPQDGHPLRTLVCCYRYANYLPPSHEPLDTRLNFQSLPWIPLPSQSGPREGLRIEEISRHITKGIKFRKKTETIWVWNNFPPKVETKRSTHQVVVLHSVIESNNKTCCSHSDRQSKIFVFYIISVLILEENLTTAAVSLPVDWENWDRLCSKSKIQTISLSCSTVSFVSFKHRLIRRKFPRLFFPKLCKLKL